MPGFQEIGAESFLRETRIRVVECCVLAGEHARALGLLDELEGDSPDGGAALLELLRGYALTQARRGDEGASHLARSLELARAGGTAFEQALSLRAIADTTSEPGPRAESDEILARLGVIGVPHVPLP